MSDLAKHDKVEKALDKLFGDHLAELEPIKKNVEFDKKIQKNPIKDGEKTVKVFGCYTFDPACIFKLNRWNRSIYSTDKLIRLGISAPFEMQKKYLAKKRKIPMNIIWLLLLMMGVGVAVIVLILFLKGGGLGGII